MKKRIFAYLATLLIGISVLSITTFAATTYTSELGFQGEHKGPVREYTGQTMVWFGDTYTQYQLDHMPDVFWVHLYRKNFFGSTFIGTVECSREGYNYAKWTNVGSGDYYFYYTKARDGANVKSDKITMRMTDAAN